MELPLIDLASMLFLGLGVNLQNCYIIGVQHILPSTYEMFRALLKMGLKKENLSLLGKCYSTDPHTINQMIIDGIDVSKDSIVFDSYENYDKAFKNNIGKFLKERIGKVKSSSFDKIIIIDDGGELLEELDKYIDDYSNIVAIEQTSSGYNRLKNKQLSFPVINLARSEAKLTHEYPRIIYNAKKKISKLLKDLKRKVNKVLIVGKGNMGRMLSNALEKEYDVLTYDKNHTADINESLLKYVLKDMDLIIGCTGTTSLSKEYHSYLKEDSLLVSVSSSDREFDTVHFRKKLPKTNCPWKNVKYGNIVLANNGFPISFDNNNMDDSCFFQLTRSLIMASIFQAINLDNNKQEQGLIDLDQDLQDLMINNFMKHQKEIEKKSIAI